MSLIKKANQPAPEAESRIIKQSLEITKLDIPTFIYAVAVAKEETANTRLKLESVGVCLQPSVYDSVRDLYVVLGVEKRLIGVVPFSYMVSIPDMSYAHYIPLPVRLFRKHFDPNQRKNLDSFLKKYPAESHVVRYLQFRKAI